MKNFYKISGIAALLHAIAYLFGIGLYVMVLSPILDADPGEYVAQLPNYQSLMYWWIFICYLVAGFCLVPVSLALHKRLSAGSPNLTLTSTILGCIWAALIIGSGNLMLYGFGYIADLYAENPDLAETVWVTLHVVEIGIVSGNELIGGVWAFLFSLAALSTGGLSKALSYFGLVVGVSGILSIVPPLSEVGSAIFGLSMIAWFAWLGIALFSSTPGVTENCRETDALYVYEQQ